MTSHPAISRDLFDEMHGLVAASLNGTMSTEQECRLDGLIHHNAEAFHLYLNLIFESSILLTWAGHNRAEGFQTADHPAWISDDMQLRQVLSLPLIETAGKNGDETVRPSAIPTVPSIAFHAAAGYLSSGWPLAYLLAIVIVSVGIAIGGVVRVSQPSFVARQLWPAATEKQAAITPRVEIVGQITRMAGCRWADPKRAPSQNAQVPLGRRYALAAGLMEITYNTGAKVILQGPVVYEAESKNGGFLAVGKLTGEVITKAARGLAIRTPTATITDLGTEFGVEVGKTGLTSARVFQGKVEVRPVSREGRLDRAVELRANDFVEVARGGDLTVRRGTTDPSTFVRSEQIQKLVDPPKSEALCRWQAHAQKIRRDPALVAYYDFQRHADAPNLLRADAAGGETGRCDGMIEGAVWAKGRMPGKDALQFDGEQARVRIHLPRRITAMTLATWISIDFIPDNKVCDLVAPDGWDDVPGKCNVQITRQGVIHFDTSAFGIARTPPVLPWQEWKRVRWHCLAIVVDPERERTAWFVDGANVFQGSIAKDFFTAFDSASIGNWWSLNNTYERGFNGRMDELMILGRAVTEQEIREMYQAGKP